MEGTPQDRTRRPRDNPIDGEDLRLTDSEPDASTSARSADVDRAIESLLSGWPVEARTPPERSGLPTWEPDEGPDLKHPDFFLNREFGWLNFNFRVLHESEDPRVPLLERLRFISIVSSNLDRFFMTRIGGLKQQFGAGLLDLTVDGHTPQEQIDRSCELVGLLEERKRQAASRLIAEMHDNGIVLTTYGNLDEAEQAALRAYYVDNVYPLVTPQATDPAHPFPFVSNLSVNLLVSLRYPGDELEALARVKVPVGAGTKRFLKLDGRNTFVTLESVMAHNLDLLFPGMDVASCELFRVTRNANTELDEDKAEDLLELIESGLRERRFAPIVRLEVGNDMAPIRRGMLAAELGLDENTDVFEVESLMAMRDLEEIVKDVEDPSFHFVPHAPVDNAKLGTERSMFHVIRESGALLLHFPYESFTTSIDRFLREASRDPKVRAIKMTIYRTSEKSKAIQYLMDAAQNGKQVTVVVELKARFDEAANIRWANRLGQAGIHVTYGVVGLKTHCKAILVVRQDFDGLRRYAHIGTGNYHADTARLYADLGLMTSDEAIGKDLTELFNYLTTGFKPKRDYRKLLPAPKILKAALLKKIEREIEHHSEGSPGLIQFKMNALEDSDVTRALYRAARAGVQVDLLVRDSCRLRPGIPGLSESVRVISVVGRFLEHARVYYFRNGGEEEYYVGSADCMRRNLQNRVELFAPVEDPELQTELRFLLDTQLADQRNGWEMNPDGSYVKRGWMDGKERKGSHDRLIARAEKRIKAAMRLRRRRPRGIGGVSAALLAAFLLSLSMPARAAVQESPLADQMVEVDIEEWEVPWPMTRPRDPYVDGQGRVWFVGQVDDYVAYLEPESGEFTRFDLAPGAGPHNLIVAEDGIVWYAGNRMAHIGRLDPETGDIIEFVMPEQEARDPHTLVFDSDGNIWFTVQGGNFVGHLNIETGDVNLVPVPTSSARPYGIVVGADDRPWIAEFGSYKIATVDPESFELVEYDLPRDDARPRRLELTSDGAVWYVDYAQGILGRLNPESGEFTEWPVPGGSRAGGYGMAVDDRDRVWFVESTIRPNRLVGFDPATSEFFSVTEVPSGGGTVRHMYFHPPTREIWFGTDTNNIGRARVP